MTRALPPPPRTAPATALARFWPAAALAAALVLPAVAQGACFGMNILDTLPAEERAAIAAAADRVPYPSGNLWRASRDGQSLTLVGTYHLDDPRHQPIVDALAPAIAAAPVLLVEAGPEEERQLMEHMGSDPSFLTITEGPTLLQMLPPELWEQLKVALSERGIPGFMAAKFQPWYVMVILSIPPCAMDMTAEPKGLDGMLIDTATAAGVPVRALEPYDTIFSLFDALGGQDQIALIEQTLALEPASTDFSITLADAYFDGENRVLWELMRHQSLQMPGYAPEQVDADMAVLEKVLLDDRNIAWIDGIEAAAAEGPAVVAFGALHLSGEKGVLNLLAQRGWTLEPLPWPYPPALP